MRFGTLVSVLIVLGFSTLKAIELTSLQVFFGTSAILVGGLAIGDILLPLNI